MPLIVEDGSGVPAAESYFATSAADAYWTARPQDPNGVVWMALSLDRKEGAAREASDYLDANWGSHFPGARRTTAQGRLWPRVDRQLLSLSALYPTAEALALAQADTDRPLIVDGLLLPNLPPQIVAAAIELAARAGAAPLAADKTDAGWVKRIKEKVGPLETDTEYGAPGQQDGAYGFVDRLLGPLVGGVVTGDPTWFWA